MNTIEAWNDKRRFVKNDIKEHIIDANPPEYTVAHRMWLYGISTGDFKKIHKSTKLNISKRTFCKILNYLEIEWERGPY